MTVEELYFKFKELRDKYPKADVCICDPEGHIETIDGVDVDENSDDGFIVAVLGGKRVT